MSDRSAKRASTARIAPQGRAMVGRTATAVTPHQRRSMIAEAAYYLALQRKFEPGHDVQDWLLAERQIEAAVVYNKKHSTQRS